MAAVRRALAHAAAHAGRATVHAKGERDVVTDADVAVEDLLRDSLGDLPFVGEERGGDAGDAYWLVDPICGTRNFASGIPLYAVNVALVEDGVVTVAVVGDAATGDVLLAEAGRGARAEPGGALRAGDGSGIVVVEDSHARGDRRAHAAAFAAAAVTADRWELRSFSTTLSLAWVAAGRVAGYVLFWSSPVHAAAGSLLATEAGAVVTDLAGAPWTLAADSLVAAAPDTHADLLALLAATG